MLNAPILIKNQSLLAFNTFHVEATADYFTKVQSKTALEQLIELSLFKTQNTLFLGSGSNLLFKQDFKGLIAQINIQGIQTLEEDAHHIWLKVGAGENWHDFVLHCVARDYSGIENLSYIPGHVGATPIQNIGAYGVEIKDVLIEVEGFDLKMNTFRTLPNQDCQFGYRDSVFKHALKNQFIVCAVTLKLSKQPQFQLDYGEIKKTLTELGVKTPSTRAISNAIIHLRQRKLPDPREIPNAGSFFKNPFIPRTQWETLKKAYPNLPSYPIEHDQFKIPAGWLIEKAGWKGKRLGNVGTHAHQALVIVNQGGATGQELFDFSRTLQNVVSDQFGIQLEAEVTVV